VSVAAARLGLLLLAVTTALAIDACSSVQVPSPSPTNAFMETAVPRPTTVEPTSSPSSTPSALPIEPSPTTAPTPGATPIPTTTPSFSAPAPTPVSTASPSPTASPKPPVAVHLRPPLRKPSSPKPWITPTRAPDDRSAIDGVVLELWVPHEQIPVGAWLAIHLRIRNTRADSIELGCGPVSTTLDIHPLLDPGRTWTGKAATFKERVVAGAFRLDLVNSAATGVNCVGDVGSSASLSPGESLDIDQFTVPQYWDGQALPEGRAVVNATLQWNYSKRTMVTVQSAVGLRGRPLPGPAFPKLIDIALKDRPFLAWLKLQGPVAGWHGVTFERDRRLTAWIIEHLGYAGPAPNGVILIGLRVHVPNTRSDASAGVLLDTWTGEVLGFATW
jgi:hypothetical protein